MTEAHTGTQQACVFFHARMGASKHASLQREDRNRNLSLPAGYQTPLRFTLGASTKPDHARTPTAPCAPRLQRPPHHAHRPHQLPSIAGPRPTVPALLGMQYPALRLGPLQEAAITVDYQPDNDRPRKERHGANSTAPRLAYSSTLRTLIAIYVPSVRENHNSCTGSLLLPSLLFVGVTSYNHNRNFQNPYLP